MAKITNEIIVIDLEATCWDGEIPAGEESEIIEIGVCVLSRDNPRNEWEIGSAEGMIVKPVKSKISPFCTELTTLTQADVDKGMTLFEACRRLENVYDSRHKGFASWGDYDRKMLEKCCKNVVRYPFGDTHWNMKNLYSLLRKFNKEYGMAEALKIEGLKLEGTHHRGVDDAVNTARILQRIL